MERNAINSIYRELTASAEAAARHSTGHPDYVRTAIMAKFKEMKLGFEELETLSLSSHYLREIIDFNNLTAEAGGDLHDDIASCARTQLTDLYYTQEDRRWESPCVAHRRLTVERLTEVSDFSVIYELTLTSIGHGVNQALFGIFRNFREPNKEMDAVMTMIKEGTIANVIDRQCNLIRRFIQDAMFFDETDTDLQSRCIYALGMLKMFRAEAKSYAGTALRERIMVSDDHEATRLTGGLFRLIRRNTRELRCELSYLAIRAADMDNEAIRLIANHGRENAIEMVNTKTFRKTN